MRMADVMTRHPVTIGLDDTVRSAKATLDRLGAHHLLVEEGGRLVGIVSDRDVLRALSPALGTLSESARDAATLDKKVHQVMSHHPLTLKIDAPVTAAIDLLVANGFSCVPVVDDGFRPLGIVTWRDLLKALRPLVPGS
jgi:acetoin utilization protein AcuB